jgi:hypothetical protein
VSYNKFNAATRASLITAISLGAPRYVACAKTHLDEKTLRNWLDRGVTDDEGNPVDPRPGSEEYVEFRLQFLAAEAEQEQQMLASITSDEDWKARAWYMERRFPDRYNQKTKLEHSGEVTANVVTGVVMLPPEDGGGETDDGSSSAGSVAT